MKKIKLLIGLFIALAIGSNIYAQGDFIMTYNTSLTLGETKDFINKYSWRGFGMEGRWEVADEIYVGVNGAWSVFYESEKGDFVDGTKTVSGTQYRYINAYSFMLTGYKYFTLTSRGLSVFGGAGVGPYFNETRRDYSIWTDTKKGWQFGISPEIGFLIPGRSNTDFILSVKYNYAFKTSTLPEFSTLGFNIGISY